MNKLFTFFLVIFSISNALSQGIKSEQEALELYNNQEFGAALSIWENNISGDSTNLYYLEQAGLCAYRLGNYSKAKEYFLKIGNDAAFFKTAYISLANIYEDQESIPKAIKYNNMLKDSFPDNPIYYRKLGALYLKAGIISEAFPKYAQALSLNPNDVISIKALSEIFIANSQHKEADSLLNIGLALDKENISITLLLAKNYYVQKLYDSTVVQLNSIVRRLDFSNYYNKMMGYALLQIDSVDQAIFYLEKSLVDESNPEYAHYYLANAYEVKKEFDIASFHYNKAISEGTSPSMHTYHRNLARIQKDEHNLKDAIDNYKWAYKYKEDPLLLLFLGQASDEYYKDKSIAINYYSQYVKSDDNNATYKKYAQDRIQYLKEYKHFNNQNK